MPDINNPALVKDLARVYCTNGRNKTQALIEAGYSVSYARNNKGLQIYHRKTVIDAITAYEAKIAVDTKFTVAIAEQEYDEARLIAQTQGNPTAMISATTGKARLYGYDKDNDMGTTDQQQELTESETIEARRLATLRLADNGPSADSKPLKENIA